MSNSWSKLMSYWLLAVLIWSSLIMILPKTSALTGTETVTMHKPLYVFQWEFNGVLQVRPFIGPTNESAGLPYVNITVQADNLDRYDTYQINITKFRTGTVVAYAKFSGVTSINITFAIQNNPVDLAGTYNATLYQFSTMTLLDYDNFGVWGITAPSNTTGNTPGYSLGQRIRLLAGGFVPGSSVTITDGAGKITGTYTTDPYGELDEEGSSVYTSGDVGTWDLTLSGYTLLSSSIGTPEDALNYTVAATYRYHLASPTQGGDYYRDETIHFAWHVYYLNGEYVEGGSAGYGNYTYDPNQGTSYVNLTVGATEYDIPLTWSGTATELWEGDYYIDPCAPTTDGGTTWYFTFNMTDPYSNYVETPHHTLNVWEDGYGGNYPLLAGDYGDGVRRGLYVNGVFNYTPVPIIVPRGSWVSFFFNVSYPFTHNPVTSLDLAVSTVVVYNISAGADLGPALLSATAIPGVYNATYHVDPWWHVGTTYRFVIYPWSLNDTCTPSINNWGPGAAVYSLDFVVENATLSINATTWDDTFTAMKSVFMKWEDVGLQGEIRYPDNNPLTPGEVTIGPPTSYVYFRVYDPYWNLVFEHEYVTDGLPSYNLLLEVWRDVFDIPPSAPFGVYTFVIVARDDWGNAGENSTIFTVGGVLLDVHNGTVPPDWMTTIANPVTGLVDGGYYTDPYDGDTLGTYVTIRGYYFTPNSYVDVWVFTPTYTWYRANYYGDTNVVPPWPLPFSTYAALLMADNVPTDSDGNFTASFWFPSVTSYFNDYYVAANDSVAWDYDLFTVKPGLVLTPPVVWGPRFIETYASGYTNDTAVGMLVNGTDATMVTNIWALIGGWTFDGNGTLRSNAGFGWYFVQPGFTLLYVENSTYVFSILSPTPGEIASDTVYVMMIDRLVSLLDRLELKLDQINATLTQVNETVYEINTTVGYLKLKCDALWDLLVRVNATVTQVNDTVTTINTTVGYIKTKVDDIWNLLVDMNTTFEMKLDQINNTVNKINDTVNLIKDDTTYIRFKVDALWDLLVFVNATVTQVNETVTQINGTVNYIKVKTDDIWNLLVLVNATVTQINGTVAFINSTVTNINNTVNYIKAKADAIWDLLVYMNATFEMKLDQINDTVTLIKDDTHYLRLKCDALWDLLVFVNATVTQVNETVTQINGTVNYIKVKTDDIWNLLVYMNTTFEMKLDQINDTVTYIKNKADDIWDLLVYVNATTTATNITVNKINATVNLIKDDTTYIRAKADAIWNLLVFMNTTLVEVNDTVFLVYNDTQYIRAKADDIWALLTFMNATLVKVNDTVAFINGTTTQINGTVTYIKAKVDDIWDLLVDMNATITDIRSDVSYIKAKVDDIWDLLVDMNVTFEMKLDQINNTVSQINGTVNKINGTVNFIKNKVIAIKSDTGTIRARVNAIWNLLTEMNATITDIKNDVAVIKSDTGYIRMKVDDLRTLIENVNASLAEIINNNTAVIRTDLGDIKALLSTLNANVLTISDGVATIQTTLGQIKSSLSTIDAKITSLSDDTATIKTTLGTVTTSLSNINAKIDSLSNDVATIKTDLGTVKGTVTDISNNVATIKTDLGTVKIDVGNIKGATGTYLPAITGLAIVIIIIGIIAAIFARRS